MARFRTSAISSGVILLKPTAVRILSSIWPLVPAPQMATARGAGQTVTSTQNNTINITQQPGQDSKALAAEVARELDRRNGVRARGMMFDPVTP